jgi:hypothetical protein
MRQIDCHLAESDADGASEIILDTKHWLDCNSNLDKPNNTADNSKEDNECNVELDNKIEHPETPQQWNMGAALYVPRLIWPIRRSKDNAEMVFISVYIMDTRGNKGKQKMSDTMQQCIFTRFCMLYKCELHIEK